MKALLKECFVLPAIIEIRILTFLHHEKIRIRICVKKFLELLTEAAITVPTYYFHIESCLIVDLKLPQVLGLCYLVMIL